MQPALRVGLNASGICANYPRAAVFGPEKYQGLGVPHLYTTMCINHLEDMIMHRTKSTSMGDLYCVSVEQLMVKAGVGSDIFAWEYKPFQKAVTKGLAQHMWKFLSESNLYLRTSGIDMSLRQK